MHLVSLLTVQNCNEQCSVEDLTSYVQLLSSELAEFVYWLTGRAISWGRCRGWSGWPRRTTTRSWDFALLSCSDGGHVIQGPQLGLSIWIEYLKDWPIIRSTVRGLVERCWEGIPCPVSCGRVVLRKVSDTSVRVEVDSNILDISTWWVVIRTHFQDSKAVVKHECYNLDNDCSNYFFFDDVS